MVDDLIVPQVPEAIPDDPEDVSWALSTAEAMWARGDHAEGIKWVRRAAEAASEAENDNRALQLAKAAADLTNMIARMSRVSVDIEEIEADAIEASRPIVLTKPPVPKMTAPPAPPAVTKPTPGSITKQVSTPSIARSAPPPASGGSATPSRPPAPLPSRTSQPPPPPGASGIGGLTAAGRGKPLGTNSGKGGSARPPPPGAGAGVKSSERPSVPPEKKDAKKARRSRDNLDAEARRALAPKGDLPTTESATSALEVPVADGRVLRTTGDANNDPTMVGHVDEIIRPKKKTAADWDKSPTQDLTGDDLNWVPRAGAGAKDADPDSGSGFDAGERTAVGVMTGNVREMIDRIQNAPGGPGTPIAGGSSGSSPPATLAGPGLMASGAGGSPGSAAPAGVTKAATPSMTPAAHDPRIVTSQAVRVVVWRDNSGVHVAPAGTVVSAITVDAVLVALEPNADLTAWLSQRTR